MSCPAKVDLAPTPMFKTIAVQRALISNMLETKVTGANRQNLFADLHKERLPSSTTCIL